MSRAHGRITSFKFAFQGIGECIKNEPNFKIHIITGVLATSLAYYLGFSAAEWMVLTLVIALVLILELLNTAIEAVTNLLSPEKKQQAKLAKDVAAAAVLVSAIAAIIIGLFLFLPKLLTFI